MVINILTNKLIYLRKCQKISVKNKRKVRNIGKKIFQKLLENSVGLKHLERSSLKKCYISWCENEINVFDFHVGHDKPESEGGTLAIDNLKPICARCNLSMSNNFTISEWNKLNDKHRQTRCCIFF